MVEGSFSTIFSTHRALQLTKTTMSKTVEQMRKEEDEGGNRTWWDDMKAKIFDHVSKCLTITQHQNPRITSGRPSHPKSPTPDSVDRVCHILYRRVVIVVQSRTSEDDLDEYEGLCL